ncbi:hypothetical protein CXP34_15580 [Ralstonia mannitolilytica]|nr:hypothetical protein CXP34_15580 [Ralstonia mannitolilytica]
MGFSTIRPIAVVGHANRLGIVADQLVIGLPIFAVDDGPQDIGWRSVHGFTVRGRRQNGQYRKWFARSM